MRQRERDRDRESERDESKSVSVTSVSVQLKGTAFEPHVQFPFVKTNQDLVMVCVSGLCICIVFVCLSWRISTDLCAETDQIPSPLVFRPQLNPPLPLLNSHHVEGLVHNHEYDNGFLRLCNNVLMNNMLDTSQCRKLLNTR